MNNDQIKLSFDDQLNMSTVVIDDVISSLKSGTLGEDEKNILDNIQSYLYKSRDKLDSILTKGEPELLKFKTAFFYINLLIDEIDKIMDTKIFKNPNRSMNKVYRYKAITLEITNLNEAFFEYGNLIEYEINLED